MSELFIGLMSGTSMDGIDAALVDFASAKPPFFKLLASYHYPLPPEIQSQLAQLCEPGPNEIMRLGHADVLLGRLFAHTVSLLLARSAIPKEQIIAIGSHGLTIRHHPHGDKPFTLQIGDPNVIAEISGITTIADFRRRDIAAGGQGAPLAPGFHRFAFQSPQHHRIILNIGGMANITLLEKNGAKAVTGFDTGPGNTLLDAWTKLHLQQPYDENGAWASTGKLDEALLVDLLSDPYFQKAPPKSTGKEYFNLAWLQTYLNQHTGLSPVDIARTLLELTAQSIMNDIHRCYSLSQILVCGGGIHNNALWCALDNLKGEHALYSTQAFGIHPNLVEAMAWAWLAKQTMHAAPGNLSSVTGAHHDTVLGGIYL